MGSGKIYSGSRIRGQKGTGSRIRNTGLYFFTLSLLFFFCFLFCLYFFIFSLLFLCCFFCSCFVSTVLILCLILNAVNSRCVIYTVSVSVVANNWHFVCSLHQHGHSHGSGSSDAGHSHKVPYLPSTILFQILFSFGPCFARPALNNLSHLYSDCVMCVLG